MSSKFSGLLQAKQAQSLPSEVTNTSIEPVEPEIPAIAMEPPKEESQVAPPPAVVPGAVINMQPPRGKKGHPDYNQVTIYLKKETHNKAKIALLQSGSDKDFSELVEELVNRFLEG